MMVTDHSLLQGLRRIASRKWILLFALALVLAWPALAQTPDPQTQEPAEEEGQTEAEAEEPPEEFEEEITVTGTRVEGPQRRRHPRPGRLHRRVGHPQHRRHRDRQDPAAARPRRSTSPRTFVSDGTDIVRPATLRALGPDQVLVLVNGKRRHQQALVNVQQTIGRGSAGYDINAIPASAIDRIEVLRDGAAAQYGSDAIAGVINIILKNQTERHRRHRLDGGQHLRRRRRDARRPRLNTGFKLGERRLRQPVTVEDRDRGETNRAGPRHACA